MQEFMLIFRQSLGGTPPSPEQMKSLMSQWEEWRGSIAAQGKFVAGKRLTHTGKVLKGSGLITDGPFVEIKEQLGGYCFVTAENLDEAVTLAHGCPVLKTGGSVEIRPVMATN